MIPVPLPPPSQRKKSSLWLDNVKSPKSCSVFLPGEYLRLYQIALKACWRTEFFSKPFVLAKAVSFQLSNPANDLGPLYFESPSLNQMGKPVTCCVPSQAFPRSATVGKRRLTGPEIPAFFSPGTALSVSAPELSKVSGPIARDCRLTMAL